MPDKPSITVQAVVNAPVDKTWTCWTEPDHITKWNHASDDWHSPHGKSDLREGGKFSYRMEAKDGSVGFDFGGTFTTIVPQRVLEYMIEDGRAVSVMFEDQQGKTLVTETFEAEETNPIEMQKQGWQAILDNFKKYTESQK